MSPIDQRIALAEAEGWTNVTRASLDCWEAHYPKGHQYEQLVCGQIPDYLNDWNALHHLIKTLTPDQLFAMDSLLGHSYEVWLCTPAQVAEALLRILKLWTGGDTEMVA